MRMFVTVNTGKCKSFIGDFLPLWPPQEGIMRPGKHPHRGLSDPQTPDRKISLILILETWQACTWLYIGALLVDHLKWSTMLHAALV